MRIVEKQIFLIDGQSFYASIEKAAHPEYNGRPIAVGDPSRSNGIVLAACPQAKAQGVTTASRVGEALAACPDLVVIRPRMHTYIHISLLISEIFQSYTSLVEPFSIDEQFLDVTASQSYYGPPFEMARRIQEHVLASTGVWTRVGIGPTKVLAKMAMDNFAKKTVEGVFQLSFERLGSTLWQLPVKDMFMVGSAMSGHFTRMGITQIGDIASMELSEFKRRMQWEMGRQSDIQAEYYWQTACGIDPSPVMSEIRQPLKSVSHGKALRWSLYGRLCDIETVLLELVIEVCQRTRRHRQMASTVCVSASETDGIRKRSFSRQMALQHPTALTHEVAAAARHLFIRYWSGLPLCQLSVALSNLSDDDMLQLTLFDDRSRAYDREVVIDRIKERYGSTAIMRASSLLEGAIAEERSKQIGGHYK